MLKFALRPCLGTQNDFFQQCNEDRKFQINLSIFYRKPSDGFGQKTPAGMHSRNIRNILDALPESVGEIAAAASVGDGDGARYRLGDGMNMIEKAVIVGIKLARI